MFLPQCALKNQREPVFLQTCFQLWMANLEYRIFCQAQSATLESMNSTDKNPLLILLREKRAEAELDQA